MSDPSIEEVAFNFKTEDGATVRHKLTRKNILIGPNGSGKSAVPQAVALAVSGAVDYLAGRRVTKDPGLLTGMMVRRALDGETMFSRVNLSNGETCLWETSRDGSRIKTPKHEPPAWVIPESKEHSPHFPLRAIEKVLSGSPKKAREQFLSWVCQDLSEDVVLKHLSRCTAEYRQLTDALDGYAPADKLTHAVSAADREMKKLNADAKANAKLREELAQEVSAKVDDVKVLAARDEVKTLEAAYEAAVRADAAASSGEIREQINRTLGLLRTQEQTLLDDIAKHEQYEEGNSDDDIEYKGIKGAVDAYIWAANENYFGAGTKVSCAFCSSEVSRPHVVSCHRFYETSLADATKARSDANWGLEQLREFRRKLQTLRGRIQGAQEQLANLPVAGESSDTDLEQVRADLSDARASLENLTTAATKWSSMSKAGKRETEATLQAGKFRALKIDGAKAIQAILSARTSAFCARVSGYLPRGWEFGVLVDDGGRDVFYYGLYAGEDEDRYLKLGLSEGQRAGVLVAICAVLDEMNEIPLSILVVPDCGWDVDTLNAVLVALEAVPQHVFLTTCTWPTKNRLYDWNVIETTAPTTPKLKLGRAKLPAPELSEGDSVDVAPILAIDPMLLAEPAPMPPGRGRGGKFRAIKNRLVKEVAKHGFTNVLVAFSRRHPEATFVEGVTPEEFAETVAHFLFPVVLDS